MHVGKFHTIIFTKKHIKKIFMYFIIGMAASFTVTAVYMLFNSTTIPKTHINIASNNTYLTILDNELPVENDNNILNRIIGFDIKNPTSILSYFSPLFEENNSIENDDNVISDNNQNSENTQSAPPYKTESLTTASGMKLSNATSYTVDLNALANESLAFKIADNEPQVLVVHTHTTESYSDVSYTSSDRTTDENKNIVSVGNVITDILNEKGIKTIHDTTVHDYPSYNGAYTRALKTIQKRLDEYPSIKVVLDVHRDGIVRQDGTKVKVITEINGIQTAQVMIVAGTDACGLKHDNWKENLKFAAKIQKAADKKYPELMRAVNLREERFNTHTTLGSLILEVGSNGNTLEEARAGARYAAEAIADVLLNNKKK